MRYLEAVYNPNTPGQPPLPPPTCARPRGRYFPDRKTHVTNTLYMMKHEPLCIL